MIGAMLGLLGPGLRALAKEYLYPHSFEWLAGKLPWSDPGRTRERWEIMGGKTIYQALELIQAGVRVEEEDRLQVTNLLGNRSGFPSNEFPNTLIAGGLQWPTSDNVLISLRRIEPDQVEGRTAL